MTKMIIILVLLVAAYFGSAIVSAYFLEAEAEDYMHSALVDIAKPWSAEKLTERASMWMLELAKLTPQKLVYLAAQDLGDFIKFNNEPDCFLTQGYDSYSTVKHTYAICDNDVQFEKQSAHLKIRLVQENESWKINNFISID